MAGRGSKPIELVKGHRTKAEKKIRAEAEKELLTGIALKEWPEVKKNPAAHKEFLRVKKVLNAIKKDDALHEAVINRYCLLCGECQFFEALKETTNEELKELWEQYQKNAFDYITYLSEKDKIYNRLLVADKKIMEKRKMMFDIEKENIMTIQSALRSVPKKEQSKGDSPIAAFLKQRAGINGS